MIESSAGILLLVTLQHAQFQNCRQSFEHRPNNKRFPIRGLSPHSFKVVLVEAEASSKRIYNNVQPVNLLSDVEGVLSLFIEEAVEEFETIYHKLFLIQEKIMNRTTAQYVLTSPSALAQLKGIVERLCWEEHMITVMGLIAKCAVDKRSLWNGIGRRFSKVLMEQDTEPNSPKPVRSIFSRVCQKHISNSKRIFLRSQCRQDRWPENIDIDGRYATGIAFYEGNQSIQEDFAKAARYLDAALRARNSEANYYLGMMYSNGNGVQMCNETAFQLFERGTRAEDPEAMRELAECYLLGVSVDINEPLAVAYSKMASDAGDPKGMY